MLPFTHAQFLGVFAGYNANVWPAQLVAYALGLAMVLRVLGAARARSETSGRWVAAALALMWLWTGFFYHGVHFSRINKAAWLFGAMFVLQGLLLARAAATERLRYARPGKAAAWLGGFLIVYATVLYPLLGLWAGFRPNELPMFGITPCPVTIFTFGIFLLAIRPVPTGLLVIPVLWALIGGSAAFLLRVPQDWALLASAFSVIVLLRARAGDSMTGHV